MKLKIVQLSAIILSTIVVISGYTSTVQRQTITISDSVAIALIGGLPAAYVVEQTTCPTQ
jgi:hypothetical protein